MMGAAPFAAHNEEYAMQTLRHWRAVRSGANIRVTGHDTANGQEVKVQASYIEPRRGGLVIATTKDGDEYSLVE